MSRGIHSTSLIHQMAYMAGARVEVWDKDIDNWCNISSYFCLGYKQKYRINPADENIYQKVLAAFNETHTKVLLKDSTYYVPSNAMNGQAPVLFIYGMGIYCTVTEDGQICEMSPERIKSIRENQTETFYVARSEYEIFDIRE